MNNNHSLVDFKFKNYRKLENSLYIWFIKDDVEKIFYFPDPHEIIFSNNNPKPLRFLIDNDSECIIKYLEKKFGEVPMVFPERKFSFIDVEGNAFLTLISDSYLIFVQKT